jgi:hypothetical protein
MVNEAMRALVDAQTTLRRSLTILLPTLPASFSDDHCVNELNLPASAERLFTFDPSEVLPPSQPPPAAPPRPPAPTAASTRPPTASATAAPTAASAAPTDVAGGRKLLRASGSGGTSSTTGGGTSDDGELQEKPWLGYVAITESEPYVPILDRVVPF